ncbi:MAG: hypothetical protein ACREVV_09775 [Steroidobacteraceae bacterium]
MSSTRDMGLSRRDFVNGAVSGAALAAVPAGVFAAVTAARAHKAAVLAQIPKMQAGLHIRQARSVREAGRGCAHDRLIRRGAQ